MSNPFKRETAAGTEYSDGSLWFDERNCCHHCQEQREAEGRPFAWAEERYSFGIYAGRWCDGCWPQSGFRDATDPNAEFSELDAGECLEPEPDFGGAFDGFSVYSDADPGL